MRGPCFGHKRAIFWPFKGKGATGYTQQYEIWLRTYLGTLIKTQEGPIWRTMWGLCLGHKMAMFWPFLGIGAREFTQQFDIWHWAFLDTSIVIQEEPNLSTMWGPHLGCIGLYFGHSYKRGLQDTSSNIKFAMQQPWAQKLRFRKFQFKGPCFCHIRAIFWPFPGK